MVWTHVVGRDYDSEIAVSVENERRRLEGKKKTEKEVHRSNGE